jgi:phospholipase/lecithinase/hemolysin
MNSLPGTRVLAPENGHQQTRSSPSGYILLQTSQTRSELTIQKIGINDLGNSYYLDGDRAAFSDTLISAQFALVTKLYNVGARNFLIVNVPPTDRSPLVVGGGDWAVTHLHDVIVTHNAKLANATSSFQSTHTGSKTYLYDSWSSFTKILNNYAAYGFDSNTTYGGTNDFW